MGHLDLGLLAEMHCRPGGVRAGHLDLGLLAEVHCRPGGVRAGHLDRGAGGFGESVSSEKGDSTGSELFVL